MQPNAENRSNQKTSLKRMELVKYLRKCQRIDGKIEGKMTDCYPTGEIKGVRISENDKQDGKTYILRKWQHQESCNTI
ncbi:MAG: hypothetical protein IPJ39_21060 [Saprospiraceae bacterium]|nr:hypothetical protein [Saprospiraceae bacterium]